MLTFQIRQYSEICKDVSIIMAGLTDQNRNKSGRGYTKYHYTIKDIAEASDRKIGTVRNDISKGKLNPMSLSSVSWYIEQRRK